MGEFNTV